VINERFRTKNNIFANNTIEGFESETPFNIQVIKSTKHKDYSASMLDLGKSVSIQKDPSLFEDTLEQESPFRMIRYTEGETPRGIVSLEMLEPEQHSNYEIDTIESESLEPEQHSSFHVPTNLTMDPCTIPANEKPTEPVMGIPQAPSFSKDAYWPLVSSEPPIVSYRKQGGGSTPGVGTYGRQFMALRKRYDKNKYLGEVYHGAIDLYAKENDPVIAIEDGEITRFVYFYLGTWGIVVKHLNVTVIYGEVSGDSLVFANLAKKVGPFVASTSQSPIPVKAGQVIGRIIRNTSYNRSSMLHVEVFDNNYRRNVPWQKGNPNPHRGLRDPSLALLKLARCGKRATGSPQTTTKLPASSSKDSIDIAHAVLLNRDYSVRLGWQKYQDKIQDLLGFTNSSPTEQLFAEAVANWQKKQGFKADGIIGPNTWLRMKNVLGIYARDADKAGTSTTISSSLDGISQEKFGTLTTVSRGGISLKPFRYTFSAEDALWTAKFIIGEAGGRDDIDNRAVIWAMFNRYALFTNTYYDSFQKFLRAYSTPLQPVLKSAGAAARHYQKKEYIKTGGYYDPPYNYIPKGLLSGHRKLQEMRWNELPQAPRNLAVRALKGLISNAIGNATEFASTRVYFIQANKREPSDDEWQRYTEEFARKKNWKWVGPIANLNQKNNAFFIQRRRLLPADKNSPLLTDITFDIVKVI
jgi:hypothetical protein